MSTSKDEGTVPRIELPLPSGWMRVPLATRNRKDEAAREVEAFVDDWPLFAPVSNELYGELLASASECARRDVIDAAFTAQMTEDGGVVQGWLEVTEHPRSIEEHPDVACSRLLSELSAPTAADTRPRECEICSLPAGAAVRLSGARDAPGQDGEGFVVEYLQYWLPVEGSPTTIAVCSMTPNVGRAGHLIPSIEAVVAGLTLHA